MVFFNYALRKLNAKIVYYGPGLCGKTTNLQWIHDHFEGGQRGKMISLATEGDRTIFFDLLPIDIGTIRGMDVTLQLYTVPGQVHYNSTRQLVLRGADGVVFVADSQRTMKASNVESFENLQENLMLQGIDLKDFPHILQFNKRDLRDLLSTEDLNESLNVFSVPIFEAIATEGIGVQESLEGIVKLVMRNLREKYEPVASAGGPQPLSPMQPSAPSGVQTPEAAAPPSNPLAPDFVSDPEPPRPETPTSVEMPAAAAPPEEPVIAGQDIGLPAFQDEDGIATAVYEGSDDTIAEIEAQLGSSPVADEPAAPVEGAVEEEPVKSEHFQGLFTDPRDEDGTSDAEVPAVEAEPEPVVEEPPAPEIVVEEPEPEVAEPTVDVTEEGVDDLFEAEPPTVKAYMEEAIDVIETQGQAQGEGEEPALPPVVDVAAPRTEDRYEDRIEAPGPFAPPPVHDEPAEAESEPEPAVADDEPDHEKMHDEILQAFGSSENREALASLTPSEAADAAEPATAADSLLEDPPEVEPVTPPEPTFEEEPVEFVDEETPAVFDSALTAGADDEPSTLEAAAFADGTAFAAEADGSPDDAFADHDPVVVEPTETEVEEPASEEMPTIIAEPPEPDPEPAEETVEEPVEEPVADEISASPEAVLDEMAPIVVEAAETESVAIPNSFLDDPISRAEPIMVGSGDPFADDDPSAPEVVPVDTPIVPADGAIDVTAQDNQLHLQLKGSGAIAEMGQVRALDIEVPVPGQWVGNRKVTLQLRLTLTPAEDDDG